MVMKCRGSSRARRVLLCRLRRGRLVRRGQVSWIIKNTHTEHSMAMPRTDCDAKASEQICCTATVQEFIKSAGYVFLKNRLISVDFIKISTLGTAA
jgi:hypothetical protein